MSDRDRSSKRVPGVGDGFSEAISLVITPLLFGFVGTLLDGWLGTGRVLMIALGVFGVLAAITTTYYRYLEASARHDAGKPWNRSAPR